MLLSKPEYIVGTLKWSHRERKSSILPLSPATSLGEAYQKVFLHCVWCSGTCGSLLSLAICGLLTLAVVPMPRSSWEGKTPKPKAKQITTGSIHYNF